jgi:hypothetical protein
MGCALEKTQNGYKAYTATAVLSPDSSETGCELTIQYAEGETSEIAFNNIDKLTSGKIFFGQCAVVICDENSVDEMTEFCKNNNEMSKNVILLTGDNSEKIYSYKYANTNAIQFIEDFYDNNNGVQKVTLNDYLIAKSENITLKIPNVTENNGIKIE